MSRTHKTESFAMQAIHEKDYEAHHDHRNGDCDLPPPPKKRGDLGRVGNGRCFWTYSKSFWYTHRCSCDLCGGGTNRRKERREGKREARQALKEVA